MSKLTPGFLKFIDLKWAWLDRGFLFFFFSFRKSRCCFSSCLSCLVSAQATSRLSPRQHFIVVFTLFNFHQCALKICQCIHFSLWLYLCYWFRFFCPVFFTSFFFSIPPPPRLQHPHPPARSPLSLPGTLLFSSPPLFLSLSLSVNENVLTRKKDLLGIAQFIRKAEVW